MDNDNDFTFCQVSSPVDQNLALGIDGIDIKGEYSNGGTGTKGTGVVWSGRLSGDDAGKEEKTVGSLSFNVVDASVSREKSNESVRQAASRNAGPSVKNVEEQRVPAARKPAPRAKVPFEKGYSQMDWLKLTRTHPDLAGLKGQSNKRLISMDEVKKHQTEGSMWTVLKGRVYNLSPYMKFHPGGRI
ncbi:hypothetical protein Tsubulata_000554 [Turnera subulata]|uniref:Cytochrome b5 heme-binding domain-containing protein n=1 Tax=Turnera subulata TaxID=218843 RepID=A0A9Q0FM97_9ROSI|nr:hypothetical protein Tsubulata_000554 [Turnera subulata]